MKSRKAGYLIGVILLAVMMSAPQVLFGGLVGVITYLTRRWPLPIPGLTDTELFHNRIAKAEFWRGQFVYPHYGRRRNGGVHEFAFDARDPETGQTNEQAFKVLSRNSGVVPFAFGDRLWFFGTSESFELVDGLLQPSEFAIPNRERNHGQQFLLDGQPAFVSAGANGIAISTFNSGVWSNTFDVVFPDQDRDWTFGNTQVNFKRAEYLRCFNQGDQIHVFVNVDGCLLYRNGLELQPYRNSGTRSIEKGGDSETRPASALRPCNTGAQIAEWSLVREDVVINDPWNIPQGMLITGQPAVLIIEDVRTGNPVGHLYRFDGISWSLFASQSFPFGSVEFRANSNPDGQKSYILATTSLGRGNLYVVDSTGVRPANKFADVPNRWLTEFYNTFVLAPLVTLLLGIVLGLGTWILMWWFTKPNYQFGVQTVNLASLGRRGLARLIDMSLIAGTTIGFGWILTFSLDWFSLAEALNLHVDHPTIHAAMRVALILGLWLASITLFLIVIQGRCGLTPGKLCCGLRILRTTLGPCGFARSLAREVVMCVDSCNFLCWTPGILSIALTDCRQRLGDAVADTVVVEQRSLSKKLKTGRVD
jgi:uncharacterized RDD family membrane protein YckC